MPRSRTTGGAADTPPPPSPPTPHDALAPVLARAGYMMGEHPACAWTPDHALAWEGLLEVSRRLRRDAEAALEEHHDLSISMVGMMGRLVHAPRQTLRQTDLADAMGLSLSRISRIIDILEDRGLVERQSCPADARATNVKLTRAGRTRTTAAQATTFDFVQRAFSDRLDEKEIQFLAGIVARLLGDPG